MRDATTFETRLAIALGQYAELAPDLDTETTALRAIESGRSTGLAGWLAATRDSFRRAFAGPSSARLAYLLVILALLLAALLVGIAVGVFRDDTSRPLAGNGSIVFTAGGNNHAAVVTRLTDPDGSGDQAIAAGRCPTFSRDGRAMAWLTYEGSNAYLSIAGADGVIRTRTVLVEDTGLAIAFALSPDGSSVAWVKPGDPTATPPPSDELWVASTTDGRDRRMLLTADGTSPILDNPVWAPNGAQIAFGRYAVSEGTSETERTSIDVVHADGSDLQTVTTRSGPREDAMSWSPDGRSLAFTAFPDDPGATSSPGGAPIPPTSDVFVINVDGSAERNVSTTSTVERQPAWSPDGSFIAFITDTTSEVHRATTIRLHGADPPPAPILGPETEWLVWSPDGRELLWQELTPLSAEAFRTTVHAIDPDFKTAARTIQVIDGLIVCTPSWQRLAP